MKNKILLPVMLLIFVCLAIFSSASPVKAITETEKQALINQLTQQIAVLQAQLAEQMDDCEKLSYRIEGAIKTKYGVTASYYCKDPNYKSIYDVNGDGYMSVADFLAVKLLTNAQCAEQLNNPIDLCTCRIKDIVVTTDSRVGNSAVKIYLENVWPVKPYLKPGSSGYIGLKLNNSDLWNGMSFMRKDGNNGDSWLVGITGLSNDDVVSFNAKKNTMTLVTDGGLFACKSIDSAPQITDLRKEIISAIANDKLTPKPQVSVEKTCKPNWQIGEWSACLKNQQTRTITDLNKCGVARPSTDKYKIIQVCTNCKPSWQTGLWSVCEDNWRTRNVTDLNKCGINTDMPATGESCKPICYKYDCGLKVTSPNGGEVWKQGETQKITWTYSKSNSDYLTIEIVNTQSKEKYVIGGTTTESKEYSFVVPSTLRPSHYMVNIYNRLNPDSFSDTSDKEFSIYAPEQLIDIPKVDQPNQPPVISSISGLTDININEPNAWRIIVPDSEKYQTTYFVLWGDEGYIGDIDEYVKNSIFIGYDNKTGVLNNTFAHTYSKEGTYEVVFYAKNSSNNLVKKSVTVVAHNTATYPWIKVLQPREAIGGPIWQICSVQTISWDSKNVNSSFDIFMLCDNNYFTGDDAKIYYKIASVPNNISSYKLFISEKGLGGLPGYSQSDYNYCKIKVSGSNSSVPGENIVGYSNGYFKMELPPDSSKISLLPDSEGLYNSWDQQHQPEKQLWELVSGSCDPKWECSQWSPCNNGQQTRICTGYYLPTEPKPSEIQSCSNDERSDSELKLIWCHNFETAILKDLKLGDKGDEVLALQTALWRKGYNVHRTGIFDKETYDKVKAFQNLYFSEILYTNYPSGVKGDTSGVAGPKTRLKLNKLFGCNAVCGQDVKICPVGSSKSYVSRIGPNCEFAECMSVNK